MSYCPIFKRTEAIVIIFLIYSSMDEPLAEFSLLIDRKPLPNADVDSEDERKKKRRDILETSETKRILI